jgi:hypothetical protein
MQPEFNEIDRAELRERCGDFANDWILAVCQRNQLYAALKGIMRQVEMGAFCREAIEEDEGQGMRNIPLVMALRAAYTALINAEGIR